MSTLSRGNTTCKGLEVRETRHSHSPLWPDTERAEKPRQGLAGQMFGLVPEVRV